MLLLRALGLVLDLLLLPLRALAQRRAVRRGSFVTLRIAGALVDLKSPPRLWQKLAGADRRTSATSLHALAELVTALVADPRVRGMVVTLERITSGWASATSLREQLLRVRAAGKELVVHLPIGGGTKEVYVASAATRLVVGPAAQLAPLGLLHASRYAKRAVERAGVDVEVFACGDYKAAGETLVRDTMSDAQREQVSTMLDRIEAVVLEAIAEGRGVTAARARELVDGAPYFGRAAVEAGLADDVAYEDEVAAALDASSKSQTKAAPGPRPFRHLVSAARYLAVARRPLLRRLRRRPVLAVVPVHGTIAPTEASRFGKFATDEAVTRMVRAARLDPRVAGVVLHVDSPGGSALASDRMHHEIAQLAREKPVVAFFANVAASGGYYVATPARRIVAQPTTITGSIGVVAARVGLEPLLERLGVHTDTVRRGARAGLLSPSLGLTDDERAALRRELDATYDAFLGVVSAGRKRDKREIEPLAGGRVYTGADAHAVGLVDVLGGFEVALRELRALVPDPHVGAAAEPVLLRAPRHPLPLLAPRVDAARALGDLLRTALGPSQGALALAAAGERVLLFWEGPVGDGV